MNISLDSVLSREERARDFLNELLKQTMSPELISSAQDLLNQAVEVTVKAVVESGHSIEDFGFEDLRKFLRAQIRVVIYSQSYIEEMDNRKLNFPNGNSSEHKPGTDDKGIVERRIENLLQVIDQYKADLQLKNEEIESLNNRDEVEKLEKEIKRLNEVIDGYKTRMEDLLEKVKDNVTTKNENEVLDSDALDAKVDVILAQLDELEAEMNFLPSVGNYVEVEAEVIDPEVVNLVREDETVNSEAQLAGESDNNLYTEVEIPGTYTIHYEYLKNKERFPGGKLRVDIEGVASLFLEYIRNQNSRYLDGILGLFKARRYDLIELYFVLQEVPDNFQVMQLLDLQIYSSYEKSKIQELKEYLVSNGAPINNTDWIEVI